jgi:hypothetical protein
MKSFLHGRPQFAGGALVAKSVRPGAPLGAQPGIAGDSPNVEVIKQGDKVARIVVTCSCGERIELECIYPPGAEA